MQEITWYDEAEENFDHNGQILYDFADEPEVNRVINNAFTLTGVYEKEGLHSDKIVNGAILRAYCPDKTNQLFRIIEVKPLDSVIQFIAFHIAWDANNNFVVDYFESNGTGAKIMKGLQQALTFKQRFTYSSNITTTHQFTAKEGNPINILQGSNNGGQNLTGVTKGELDFDNFNIKLQDRLGQDNGFRVDFRINLDSIEAFVDGKNVKNSLYLIGETPEGDYDQEKEPIKYFYLERPGVTDKNRRIGKRTNSDCKTQEDLIKWGNELFDKDKIHIPTATHVVSMIDLSKTEEYKEFSSLVELNIGDTVHVSLNESHEDVQERMIEYTWLPRLAEYKTIVLGNDLALYSNKTNQAIQNTLKEIEVQSNILKDKILNATNLITGNSGGHVIFRPKYKPSEILIMDTPDPKTAKKVWRWNLGGLGYSSTGVDGKFGLAMTQDGEIVADYITAGVLRGIEIIGVLIKGSTVEAGDENSEFLMRLANGRLDFFDNTKADETMLGSLSSTKGATNNINGIALRQVPGYILSLNTHHKNSTRSAPVFQIPADSDADNRKWRLIGDGTVTGGSVKFENDIDFTGKVTINGEQVYPGQGGTGGGGWNGDYPSEITTQAEKFAWQAWITLISMGYSKEAAAGILGNIQGEAGPSMNPDTEQIGGPAYGAIQMDGSSYPLIGSPTNNGREYFQRLHTASGVGGDYREMAPQMKVVNWAMTNGQWIGVVDPTTVGGFKGSNSPEQAAYAFERNFERPASAHPERQGWAREWYNKFKDLAQPSGKYGFPVLVGTPVTSWFGPRWGTMHNGIDFGGVVGDPIFAAQSGTVVYSYYDNDMGEWVVIKHDNDAYMTGYAHNSARLVNVGDKVSKGQQIARMGSTGDSTGPHCHFAVQTAQWSGYVDPAPFLGLTPP